MRSSEDSSTSQRVSMGWLGSTIGAGRRAAGRGIVYVRVVWVVYVQFVLGLAASRNERRLKRRVIGAHQERGYVMMGLGAVVGELSSALESLLKLSKVVSGIKDGQDHLFRATYTKDCSRPLSGVPGRSISPRIHPGPHQPGMITRDKPLSHPLLSSFVPSSLPSPIRIHRVALPAGRHALQPRLIARPGCLLSDIAHHFHPHPRPTLSSYIFHHHPDLISSNQNSLPRPPKSATLD